MALVENDHLVEQIAAAVADEALGNAVLPRTAEAGSFGLDTEALYHVDHLGIEAGAAVDRRSGIPAPCHRERPRATAESPKRHLDGG